MGADKVVPSEKSMGGEDYSEYGLVGVPICMFRLGSVDAKRLAGYQAHGAGSAVAPFGPLLS